MPPLDYELVRALKRHYPDLPIVLNGGLASLAQMQAESEGVDGVMVGRAAYQEPALLLDVDPLFFGVAPPHATRRVAALEAFIPYVEAKLAEGVPLSAMTRHVLGLFNGLKGARAFRRHLATEAVKPGADVRILREALSFVAEADAPLASEEAA